MLNLRTDLALEAQEMYAEANRENAEIEGVAVTSEKVEKVRITEVKITSENGEKSLGKPCGTYITLESPSIQSMDPETSEKISLLMKEQLLKLIRLKKEDKVLVVGLGNWNITPDALGPKVVSEIMVTKHLIDYIPEHVDENLRPVCAISPGVLGITGVETSEIVKGIVEKIKPDLVIAIDALASRNSDRISSTIQLTDTGIHPGSGVGNKREGLNRQTLGVPVVAIGVPTVVEAVCVANDILKNLLNSLYEETKEHKTIHTFIQTLRDSERYELLKEVVDEKQGGMIVTPKEIDSVISHIAKVISNGINLSLHDGIDLAYIESFTF